MGQGLRRWRAGPEGRRGPDAAEPPRRAAQLCPRVCACVSVCARVYACVCACEYMYVRMCVFLRWTNASKRAWLASVLTALVFRPPSKPMKHLWTSLWTLPTGGGRLGRLVFLSPGGGRLAACLPGYGRAAAASGATKCSGSAAGVQCRVLIAVRPAPFRAPAPLVISAGSLQPARPGPAECDFLFLPSLRHHSPDSFSLPGV